MYITINKALRVFKNTCMSYLIYFDALTVSTPILLIEVVQY